MTVAEKCRPGEGMDRVLRALEAAPPLGLTISEVAAKVNRTRENAKWTLARLLEKGLCFRISLPRFAAYFLTKEARDAALPAVVEWHRQFLREQHAAAKERQRVRERLRQGLPADGPVQQHEKVCADALLDVLAAHPGGVTMAQAVEASGRCYNTVKKTLCRMVRDRRAWAISRPRWAMYFGSEAARDAAAAGKVEPRRAAKPAKAPKRPRAERQPRYEFRRADLDAPAQKQKVAPKIDDSRAKITRAPVNPHLENRWHTEGPAVGGFATLGVGRYLEDQLAHVPGGGA